MTPWPATWRRGCRSALPPRRRGRLGRRRRHPARRARARRRGGSSPSCHHDQTSSVTNGRNGASSRSCTWSASASAARADVGRGAAGLVVRALLDQLEVVVAELPEELLGRLERGGVVVGVERRRWPRSTTRASRASSARSTGSVTADGVRHRRADVAEHELRGVEHLHRQPAADLHLRLVERRVEARAGRSRRASGRRRRRTCRGCRSGRRRCPWTSTSSCGRGRR